MAGDWAGTPRPFSRSHALRLRIVRLGKKGRQGFYFRCRGGPWFIADSFRCSVVHVGTGWALRVMQKEARRIVPGPHNLEASSIG
jgi:hypothetical protein